MRVKFTLLLILLVSLLTACKNDRADVPGFFLPSHVAVGGKRISNINLREINVVENNDGSTTVSITFVEGSSIKGDPETPASHVPPYRVSALISPSRLNIQLQNILYWDFIPYASPSADIVSGIFKAPPTAEDEAEIYIQLNRDIIYSVEEKDGKLIIVLRPTTIENADSVSYHVVVDAFGTGDKIPDDFGLTPTLTSDYFTPTLISPPYALEPAANQQALKLTDHLASAIPGKKAMVVKLERNAVPSSVSNMDMAEAQPPGRFATTPEIIAVDAHFIQRLADGSMLIAKQNTTDESETLWKLSRGTLQPVSDINFSAIGESDLSPNGTYVAFKEETENSSPLYLLDVSDGTITFLGDQTGTQTTAFSWGDDGLLYVISGEDDITLKVFDPETMLRDELLTRLYEEETSAENDVDFVNGFLYYSDSTGTIYQYDQSSGQNAKIAEGTRFIASPSESLIAVAAYDDAVEEDAYSLLKTVNLTNGQARIVSSGRLIAGYIWSPDSTRLYYLLYKMPDEQDGEAAMLCELYSYDVSSEESVYIGDINTDTVFIGDDNELMFSCGYMGDRYIWTIYRLSLD